MEEKGYTVTFIRWDDCKEWVAGRFKTRKEKDDFLNKIHKPDSGWTNDELATVSVINDYDYVLPT